MAWVQVKCPGCGAIAEADVHYVPLTQSYDGQPPAYMFDIYRCPTGCRGEDHIGELNVLLGTNNGDPRVG